MKKFVTAIIEYSTILPFRWASNKFMCFYCSSSFELSSLLKQHAAEEHEEVKLTYLLRNMDRLTKIKLDVSKISCKLCPKPVNSLRDFMNHVTEFHDVDVNKGIADSLFSFKLDDEDMVCLDCGECFKFFSTLLSHVYKYHAKAHPFLCEACGRGFVDKTNLDNHVKTVHPHFTAKALAKSKKYKCPKCPEVLSSKYFKKQHIVTVHEGLCAQFMCDMCPRVFLFKSKLNQHKARTHLKEKSFTCDICGFKVFSRDLLRMHMVRHDASRPFECEICKKAFQRKKTLEFHRRIHTDDRRYVCKDCGRAFVQHTSLKVHRRVHQNDTNKE